MARLYAMRIAVALVVALLALSFLGGCSERPRCEAYHFHRSYPAAYQASARTAAAKWSAFSGRPVAIVDGDQDDTVCSIGAVASGSQEYADLEAEMGTWFHAAHMDGTGQILIADGEWAKSPDSVGREADFATSVLMHELAHEYGLSHVEDAPDAVMGVMYPGTNMEYNSQDRAELARVTE